MIEAEPVVPVLTLHRFSDGGLESGPSDWHTSSAHAGALIAFLKESSFTVTPVETVAAYMTAEDPTLLPEHPLAITIDDGSASIATHFEPRAAAAGIPYAVALVTGWVSDGDAQTIDVGEGLSDRILTWQEASKLAETGRVSFISHSHQQHRYANGGADGAESGPAMTTRLWSDADRRQETDAERRRRVYDDLATSRKMLAEKFRKPCTLLAWPYGLHDDSAEAAAMEAGYTHFLEFGDSVFAAPREKPHRIMRLSIMQADEAIALEFPADSVTQQRWWLAFLRVARLTKSVDHIEATLAQLDAAQEHHPEAEISRAAQLVLNGHSTLAARRLKALRNLYPHDGAVHSAIDALETAYQGLV